MKYTPAQVHAIVEALVQEDEKVPVFDVQTAPQWLDKIKHEVKAPFVSGQLGMLGGPQRVSILLTISKDPRESWYNGFLENSTYMKMHLLNDGTLEQISGYKLKFRKTKVKSAEDAVAKLNKFLTTN